MNEPSDFIIFFDGVCNLCNGFIDFIVRVDRHRHSRWPGVSGLEQQPPSFKIASLQGQTAAQKLPRDLLSPLNTIAVLDGSRTLTKSTAVLKTFELLPWPWRIVSLFGLLPPFVTDYIYDWVAAHRYKIFGERSTCRLPTPEERAYFLD